MTFDELELLIERTGLIVEFIGMIVLAGGLIIFSGYFGYRALHTGNLRASYEGIVKDWAGRFFWGLRS